MRAGKGGGQGEMKFNGKKGVSEGKGAVLVRTISERTEVENCEATDKEGACGERGERESTPVRRPLT